MKKNLSPLKVLGRAGVATTVGLVGAITPFLAYDSVLSGAFGALDNLFTGLSGDFRTFGLVIGVVVLAIALITAMVSKNEKASATGWAWVKRTIIILIVLIALPGIKAVINTVGEQINNGLQK